MTDINRRKFIGTGGLIGLGTGLGLSIKDRDISREQRDDKYAILDAVLKQPVLKRNLFPDPVIIDSVELLRFEGKFLCRVRSKDGAEGISVSHNDMILFYPILVRGLQPFLIGKDARDLDLILERILVYRLNFRLSGQALGIPLATLEFAILDMLGKIAERSVGELIGEVENPRVTVYQATEYREKPVEASLELIKRDVEEYNAQAVKIKVGGLMFMTNDLHAKGPEGRTEKMIPLIRKTFGDDMHLYADANGFYPVDEAIRVGKMLEEYKYGFFEEPVHFDWYEETKQVADQLSIPVAGGEQEYSLHGFRWLIANDGLDIVQPDNFYFGGMIRSIKAARMAQAMGKQCTPHMSGGGLGYLYMIHFVSILPNAAPHHEFKGLDTHVPFHCNTSPLQVKDGQIKVPTGPGLGIDIDPDFIAKHELVKV